MLVNLRDLGGIKTADGRTIVHNRLIRSGMLHKTEPDDLKRLAEIPVKRIIDLRTGEEQKEFPDPVLAGTERITLSPTQDLLAGITREQEADDDVMALIRASVDSDPDFAKEYFIRLYQNLADDEYAMKTYARFLKILADAGPGATLWHCTAGKDRAGFAAVLVEAALGVDRETILNDYMLTNTYLEPIIRQYIDRMLFMGTREQVEPPVRYCFGARTEYISAAFDIIDSKYGGMESYLKNQLGMDEELQNRLKEQYLE